jgi:hypothetical protein
MGGARMKVLRWLIVTKWFGFFLELNLVENKKE